MSSLAIFSPTEIVSPYTTQKSQTSLSKNLKSSQMGLRFVLIVSSLLKGLQPQMSGVELKTLQIILKNLESSKI